MIHSHYRTRLNARLHQFRRSTDGGIVSIEFLLVLPLMLWAYAGMIVFYDAYRANTEAQSAALHVADLLSRQTEVVTTAELEALNEVFEFLSGGTEDTRLRISLVTRENIDDEPEIGWSYGTRGLLSLDEIAELLAEPVHAVTTIVENSPGGRGVPRGLLNLPDQALNNMSSTARDRITARIGNATANTPVVGAVEPVVSNITNTALQGLTGPFSQPANHLPVEDLDQRVQPVLPGESLIVVESFTVWEPDASDLFGIPILNERRINPVAVTRPRFSPFLNYEGASMTFTSQGQELPPVWTPPEPEEEAPVEEEAIVVVPVVETNFSTSVPAQFSEDDVTRPNNAFVSSFLGPFGRDTRTSPVTYSVNLGAESRRATIEFDLLVLDSWDGFNMRETRDEGDILTLQINGTSIAAEAFHMDPVRRYAANRRTVASREEGVFTTTMTLIQPAARIAGRSGDNDQIWRVTIDVTAPVQTFSLGFSARLDDGDSRESFGLTNFSVTAEQTLRNAQHFVPPANQQMGTDPYLAFASYQGCPDHRIAAPTHNLSQSHTVDRLQHEIQARGQHTINLCNLPGVNSPDHRNRSRATPTYVLDWTDEGIRSNGTRLRIRTDDGDEGDDCDTNLLIREPTGEWRFNVDIQTVREGSIRADWNSRIDLGWAPSGEYHIWVGAWDRADCETDLVIERY